MSFKKIEDEKTCNICLRSPVSLTLEHVPPKSTQKWKRLRILQNFSGKLLYLREKPPGFIEDTYGGLSFQTTCADCNNSILAPYDRDYLSLFLQIDRVAHIASKMVGGFNKSPQYFDCMPGNVLRSLLGHTLATYLTTPDWPIANKIRDYTLNPNSKLPSDVYVYYWFYSGLDIKIGNGFSFAFTEDMSNSAFVHAFIKSWPLAFLVSTSQIPVLEKRDDIYSFSSNPITEANISGKFEIDFKSQIHPDWPEGGPSLEIDGMMAFDDVKGVNIRATSLFKSKSLVRKITQSRII